MDASFYGTVCMRAPPIPSTPFAFNVVEMEEDGDDDRDDVSENLSHRLPLVINESLATGRNS